MAKPGITGTRGRKPLVRKISVRSISHALGGPEQPYDVYRFSGRQFVERKGHNPFTDIDPGPGPGPGPNDSTWGDSWGTSWGASWG
jgi:hypothetical protein